MPITVECSVCGKKYRVGDERAGESIECKECGGDIDVPGGRRRRAANDSDDDDDAPSRRRPGKKKKGSKKEAGAPTGLIVAGIGGAVLVVIGLVVFLVTRGPNEAKPPGDPIAANPVPGVAPGTDPAVPAPGTNPVANPNAEANPALNPAANPAPNPAPNPNPAPIQNPNVPVPGNQPVAKAAGSGFKGGANQGGAGALFETRIVNWKAQPDPVVEKTAFDTSKKFNVKIKDGFISDDSVIYPVTPSPFAFIGDSDSKGASRDVWNLATGSKAGVVKGPRISGSNVALSPDGKFVAWFRFEAGGGAVEVWDVAGKKTLGAISVDPKKFNMAALALPSSQRMVAFSDVNTALLSWKLPTGDLEREQTLGGKCHPGAMHAFSPGGRYAAFLSDYLTKAISIYDFDTGEISEVEFVKRPVNTVLGLAFSHDGRELAIVFDGEHPSYGERIIIFNAANGAVTESIVLEEGVKKEHNLHGKGCSLQWFPNGRQFLLHGVAIVDRNAKKVVYSLGKPKLDTGSLRNRRVLDNGLFAVWEGTRQESTVQPLLVKDEDITKSIAAVEAGGLMVDAKLPKLTRFDASGLTDRSDDKTPGWQAAVDPAPAASGTLLDKPLPLKGSGQQRGLCVARQNAGLAFVRIAEGEDANDLRNRTPEIRFRATKNFSVIAQPRMKPIHCKTNWIDVYDLVKRDSTRRINVDFSCELLAASPDGTRVLVSPHDGEGRVDVFSAADGSHVAGCRPFQDEAKDENRDLQSAFFVDADHVGVINFEDRLIVYRLPDCKAVYELKDALSPRLSPGGKSLAVAREGRVELRDPLTGQPQGALELGGLVRAVAFHPNGERLAAITFEKRGWNLHDVDLSTGRAADPVPLPTAVAACHWCGDDHLLLNNSALFDVSQKTVAWTYETGDPNTTHVTMPPDGRHWMAAKAARGASVQIVAVELPDAAAKTKLAGAKLEPKMVVQPGGNVTVMAKIPERPDRPGFQAEAIGFLNKAVEKSGVKDAAGQQVKLAVSVDFKTGGMVPVRFYGSGGRKEIQLQEKLLEITVAYDFNGAVLWKTSSSVANLGYFIRVPSVENAQKALDDEMWDRARGFFDALQLPAYVFSKESVYGLGTSVLTGDGAQPKGK
jgi:WD40 repeat protein